MKRWIQKSISLLCAFLLTIQLGGQAWAETEEESKTPQTQAEEEPKTPPAQTGTDDEALEDPEEEEEKDRDEEDEEVEEEPEAEEEAEEEPKTLQTQAEEEPETPPVKTGMDAEAFEDSEEEEEKDRDVENREAEEEPAAEEPPAADPDSGTETGSGTEQRRVLMRMAPAARGGTGDAKAGSSAAEEPLLVIGEQEIDLTAAASGTGWSYDADGSCVFLSNPDCADQFVDLIGTASSDLTIKNAGLNHVGRLVVDGNLNMIGSGILLVDSIELAEDKEFKLLTNTAIYEPGAGSVAVFLRHAETDEEGNEQEVWYELINGGVTGILDGNCKIPEGVTLRIPEGSSLSMQSVTALKEQGDPIYDENGHYVTTPWITTGYDLSPEQEYGTMAYPFPSTSAPELIISEAAKLIVEAVNGITFHSITTATERKDDNPLGPTVTDTTHYVPSILVQGQLMLKAALEKAWIRFDTGGKNVGSGTLSDSTVTVRGGRETALAPLKLDGSTVRLEGQGADVSALELSGDCTLIYDADSTIGDISMQDGSRLIVESTHSYGSGETLSISDDIVGTGSAKIVVKSGNLALEAGSEGDPALTQGVSIDARSPAAEDPYEAVASLYDFQTDGQGNLLWMGSVYDYRRALEGRTTPRVAHTDPLLGLMGIPAEITGAIEVRGDDGSARAYYCGSKPIGNYLGAAQKLSYQTLSDYYRDEISFTKYKFVLETQTQNGFGSVVLEEDSAAEIQKDQVTRIRVVEIETQGIQSGGGSASDTVTTQTGVGRLGENAGSIVGGGSGGSPLFTAGGITSPIERKPSSAPTVDPVVDPDGDPDNGDDSGAGTDGEGIETPPAAQGLRIWVEAKMDGTYVLFAEQNGKLLTAIEGKIEVRMDYKPTPLQEGQKFYAVFRLPDGRLKACAARYDAAEKELIFETEQLGAFVVTAFSFAGEEFSEAFYLALAETEEVGKLT